MAKGQKKSNKEARKPKADKKPQKTISIGQSNEMNDLMASARKR